MKRVLFIIILVFGFNSIANAQCAWVLWERQHITDGEGKVVNPGDWRIVSAYPKYEQCFERQKEHFLDLKEAQGFKLSSRPFEYVNQYKESGKGPSILQELKCLPDTIDPRK